MIQIQINDNAPITLSKEILNDKKSLDILKIGEERYNIISNDKSHEVSIVSYNTEDKVYTLLINGKECKVSIKDKMDILLAEMGISNTSNKKFNQVKAPMPGLIFEISVTEGQEVKKGDKVLILEAMKMENVIKAAGDGIVKKINISKGQAVEKGMILIEFA